MNHPKRSVSQFLAMLRQVMTNELPSGATLSELQNYLEAAERKANQAISIEEYMQEISTFRENIAALIKNRPELANSSSEFKEGYLLGAQDLFSANFLPTTITVDAFPN
jgi:hypothetical protein